MSDKKPTKAERRDEAKQRRMAEMQRRERAAKRKRLITVIVAVVVAIAAAAGIVVAQKASKKKTEDFNKLAAAAGCSGIQTFPNLGQQHIQPPATAKYNSTPPTSGSHYAVGAPTTTGVHTAQIQNEVQVHNLEHGHIIIHYNGASDDMISKLEKLASIDNTRVVIEPYQGMPYKVAMTAWQHLVGCNNPNDRVLDLAKRFIQDFKGKGPEGDIPGTPA